MDDQNEPIMKSMENGFNYSQVESTFGTYFIWNSEYDEKLVEEYGEEFSWDKIFSSHPYIELFTLNEIDVDNRTDVESQYIDGYVYPDFPFISYSNYGKYNTEEIYETLATKYFELKKNEFIPTDKVSEITSFRNALIDQIKRQAEVCNKYDNQIADVLKVFWYEVDQIILTNENINDEESRRQELLIVVQELFDNCCKGISFKKLTDEFGLLIDDLKFAPRKIIKSIKAGLNAILKNKEPIIDLSTKLHVRLLAVEYLLYQALNSKGMLDAKSYSQITKRAFSNDYGLHQENRQWIIDTYQVERPKFDSQNKAVKEVKSLYKEKFGMKIGDNTIRRYNKLMD
jgi:hypothetical protein